MSKHNIKTKLLLAILPALLAIIAIVVILMAVFRNDSIDDDEIITTAESDSTVEKWQEGAVRYNGKVYRYNTAIKTYLFMGIDVDGKVQKAADGLSGGQSDAMFLLVCDSGNEKMSIIAINRNTMTNVDVYDEDSNYVGTYKLQICLQHGYGDGMRVSCIRSVNVVSRLFYNIPISGYVALNLDGIPILNDSVGGVTVQVLEDISNSSKGVELHKGDIVTLNGNEAYSYLRSRDIDVFASADARLNRQMEYMGAFFKQAKATITSSDEALNIYDSLEDYMVTSLDFSKLVDELLDYGLDESDIYSVAGETVMGTKFEEFYVDEDALYDMIIQIFYNEVDEE
jgi:LCP family protein required for cell wall assembly